MEAQKNRLEVDRIRNLIQGFGWSVSKQEDTDDEIILTIKRKRIKAEVEAGLGGS